MLLRPDLRWYPVRIVRLTSEESEKLSLLFDAEDINKSSLRLNTCSKTNSTVTKTSTVQPPNTQTITVIEKDSVFGCATLVDIRRKTGKYRLTDRARSTTARGRARRLC
jgi:hypothetical protein